MKLFYPLLVVLLLSGNVRAQSGDLQNDHIAANVPAEEMFSSYLERDLLSYFQAEVSAFVTSVTWSLLREGPTQSGLAYPKYYLWVEAKGSTRLLASGAVRVAAVDRAGFEITRFLSATELARDPEAAASVFPAPLIPSIMARAATR